MIIDKPVIEGNIDHLKTIMRAFYSYSISLISNEISLFESNLIDIKPENSHTHILLLKSSKPDVKPLNIRIGNSVLADIINCFDQLGSSNKVKNIYSKELKSLQRKKYLSLLDKTNILNFLLPPIISLGSIFLFSTTFIYLYDNNDNSSLLSFKDKFISMNYIKKLSLS